MAYIHVKKVGNTSYYSLRVSIRKGDKVITKDLENLGTDITKINLSNLEKKYNKDIRNSYRKIKRVLESEYYLYKAKQQKNKRRSFLSKEQIDLIEACHLHYKKVFSKTESLTKKETYKWFLIKFAVSSSSIEGNTITLQEAEKLFNEHRLPKDRTLREVYDLQNTEKIFFELIQNSPPITFELIETIHDGLLEKIDQRKGYRKTDIRLLGQPFKPTPGRYVQTDLKMLLKWYKKMEHQLHPLELALFFHHKFESIHPFADGNGRTGRIILNLILLKKKYPPFLVLQTQRNEYLDTLSKADQALKKNILSTDMENYQDFFNFMVTQFIETYWNTFLI